MNRLQNLHRGLILPTGKRFQSLINLFGIKKVNGLDLIFPEEVGNSSCPCRNLEPDGGRFHYRHFPLELTPLGIGERSGSRPEQR